MNIKYNTYFYKKDLVFDLSSSRQFFKIWHYGKYMQDGMNVLDIGCGDYHVQKFILDNNLNLNYYAIDVNNPEKLHEKTFFHQMDLTQDCILDKFENIKFDLIIISDIIQSIPYDCGERLLRDCYQILKTDVGTLCISCRLNKYIKEEDKGLFLVAWELENLLKFIRNAKFIVKNVFGLNYGADKVSARKIENMDFIKTNKILYDFLPDEIIRTLLGINYPNDCKFVMIDAIK